MDIDRVWQEQIRTRLKSKKDFHIWREWFYDVWLNPNEEDLKIRSDEVDYDGLPFEYNKVYSRNEYTHTR